MRRAFATVLLFVSGLVLAQSPEERLFLAIEESQPLHAAPALAQMLLAAGADARARNDAGESPLHWAAMTGNPLTAQALLERGADANVKDLKGNLPLHGCG